MLAERLKQVLVALGNTSAFVGAIPGPRSGTVQLLFVLILIDKKCGGGGGSRSATIFEFSNDFETSMRSIGKKRQNASVQVQDKYRSSADARRR
jgi:hypothetical protein